MGIQLPRKLRDSRHREKSQEENKSVFFSRAHRNRLRVVEMLREDHEHVGHELWHVVGEGRDEGAEAEDADVALQDDLGPLGLLLLGQLPSLVLQLRAGLGFVEILWESEGRRVMSDGISRIL